MVGLMLIFPHHQQQIKRFITFANDFLGTCPYCWDPAGKSRGRVFKTFNETLSMLTKFGWKRSLKQRKEKVFSF
jgi:hypothetical protein